MSTLWISLLNWKPCRKGSIDSEGEDKMDKTCDSCAGDEKYIQNFVLESRSVTFTTTPLFLCLNSWNNIKKSTAVVTLQLASLLYINNSVSYCCTFGFHLLFIYVPVFADFSKQSWSYLKIPDSRRVTWNRFHYEISTNFSRHGYLSPCFVHPLLYVIFCT
jgi:hypothetical protein